MSSICGEFSRLKVSEAHHAIDLMCSVFSSKREFQNVKKEHAVLASDSHIEKVQIQDKEIVLVMDGEIYNRDELIELCEKKGYSVESERNEELMMKLYLAFHEECLSKINGCFSVIVLDEIHEMCLAARDPMGLRPLFYALTQDGIVFSSMIRALLKHPLIKASASAEELMEMILIGPGRTPGKTYFKDIEEVKPGHRLILTKNGISIERYFFLKDESWTCDEETTADMIHQLVSDSVLRQLCKDCCAMLSGGLDSSIVCALASKRNPGLKTYSVDYKDQKEHFRPTFYQPNRDQDYIELMAEKYPLESSEVILDHQKLKDALKDAMIARDMPSMADVDSSLLCFLRKMKEEGEQIVLSGECSDEIFAGYPWYTNAHLRTLQHFPWAQNVKQRAAFLKDEFLVCDPENFVEKRIMQSLQSLNLRKGISKEEKEMKQLMKLNLDWFMSTLADRAERMARSTGMTIRVPFCDARIVQMLYQIPFSMKIKDGIEKYLLRKAFEGDLPEEICWRKKSPYPKTHHPEYERLVKEELTCIIEDDGSPIHEIIKKEKLMELLNQNHSVPWYGQLMTGPQTMAYFIQVNEWLKEYHVEIIHPKG